MGEWACMELPQSAANGRVLGYSYDANGPSNQGKRRQTGTSVTVGGTAQHTTTTTYDQRGRAVSLATWTSALGAPRTFAYTYDSADRAATMTYPTGNVLTDADNLNGQTQNFGYDHRDRLTRAYTTGNASAAYDESYTYNAIGNLTAKGPTGSLATYGYNASGAGSVRPHAVTSVGAATYAYDNNGNLTSRAGKAITWNADNTVATAAGPDNIPEGYGYDVDGQRVTRSRDIGQTGGFTTVYCGGLYEEDTPTGTIRVLYAFNVRVVAQRTVGGGTATFACLHSDLLGSTGARSPVPRALAPFRLLAVRGTMRAFGINDARCCAYGGGWLWRSGWV